MRRAFAAIAAGFLITGLAATRASAAGNSPGAGQPSRADQTNRIVESLDRGLVAVPAQGGGTFLSWRLLGTEYDTGIAFDTDPAPYDSGCFTFSTVASHFHLQDFTVWRPPTA